MCCGSIPSNNGCDPTRTSRGLGDDFCLVFISSTGLPFGAGLHRVVCFQHYQAYWPLRGSLPKPCDLSVVFWHARYEPETRNGSLFATNVEDRQTQRFSVSHDGRSSS